ALPRLSTSPISPPPQHALPVLSIAAAPALPPSPRPAPPPVEPVPALPSVAPSLPVLPPSTIVAPAPPAAAHQPPPPADEPSLPRAIGSESMPRPAPRRRGHDADSAPL